MKMKRIFAVALLLLPLSGCGIISIGYNYAEAYLRYSINSYASFNDTQKESIKKEVNIFMLWHRKIMLPEYVDFLQELQRATQADEVLKQADVARLRAKVRALYVKTLQPTIHPAASLLSGVDSEQIDEMVKSFARENKKQKDKELDGNQDEQLSKRSERTVDFLENIVGGFTDEQLLTIRDLSYKLPYATDIYIRLREDNQAGLIEMLRSKKSEAEISDFLSTWLSAPEASRSPDERRIMLAFEAASDEMIVSIYRMLTDRQKKTLQKNISKYINTFQELANQT